MKCFYIEFLLFEFGVLVGLNFNNMFYCFFVVLNEFIGKVGFYNNKIKYLF